MAKVTITNSCGHQQTYNLFGPGRERDRKLAWLKTQTCPRCRPATRADSYLSARESEIEAQVGKLLAALERELDPEQAVRTLEHQLAEGLGDETRREAARRAIAQYRAAH